MNDDDYVKLWGAMALTAIALFFAFIILVWLYFRLYTPTDDMFVGPHQPTQIHLLIEA